MMEEEYEQLEFDMTLESDRELKENVQTMIQFAFRQMKSECLPTVKNRYEGYGIVSEAWMEIKLGSDKVKSDMSNFLKILSADDSSAINSASSIYNSASDVAMAAIKMAAQAKRIMEDMYYGEGGPKTPLDDYLDSEEDEFEDALEDIEEEEENLDEGNDGN